MKRISTWMEAAASVAPPLDVGGTSGISPAGNAPVAPNDNNASRFDTLDAIVSDRDLMPYLSSGYGAQTTEISWQPSLPRRSERDYISSTNRNNLLIRFVRFACSGSIRCTGRYLSSVAVLTRIGTRVSRYFVRSGFDVTTKISRLVADKTLLLGKNVGFPPSMIGVAKSNHVWRSSFDRMTAGLEAGHRDDETRAPIQNVIQGRGEPYLGDLSVERMFRSE